MVTSPSVQASRSASSLTVAGTTSAWAWAMRVAMARRTPRNGSSGPASTRSAAARSTSATVITPLGPEGLTRARSTPLRRASARTAGVALTPTAAPARSAAVASSARCSEAGISPTTVPASVAAASWKVTSGAPTLTMSPAAPNSSPMRPERGEGTSTTALSVSTETSGWSATT